MKDQMTIYTGNDTLAPYSFAIQSAVLGCVNPVLFGLLLKTNETHELLPGLITKWEYDFKSKKYLVTLSNDRFHNGREINSDDLEFSIVRGFISSSTNYNRIHFSNILGIDKIKVGTKYKSGLVEGLKQVGPKKLQITLQQDNPIFLLNFTVPFAPLVPREELKEDYYTWIKYPIGAGPYKIESDFKDHRLILKALNSNPYAPSTIVLDNARKNNEYDLIFDEVTPTINESAFEKVLSKYPAAIASLKFYRGYEQNENVNFRKAIYYAINQDDLALGSDQFKPAYQMIVRPYGKLKQNKTFNLDAAKKLIALVPKSLREQTIKVGVYSSEEFTASMKERIEKLKSQLSEIGLKSEFFVNPEKFPTKEVLKKFTMKMSSKVVDLNDPAITYGAMSSISPYSNENPSDGGEFDHAYNLTLQEKDYEKRLERIQDISKLIEDKALTVPLLEKYVLYRINPRTIKTLGDQPKPLFLDLSKVEMK